MYYSGLSQFPHPQLSPDWRPVYNDFHVARGETSAACFQPCLGPSPWLVLFAFERFGEERRSLGSAALLLLGRRKTNQGSREAAAPSSGAVPVLRPTHRASAGGRDSFPRVRPCRHSARGRRITRTDNVGQRTPYTGTSPDLSTAPLQVRMALLSDVGHPLSQPIPFPTWRYVFMRTKLLIIFASLFLVALVAGVALALTASSTTDGCPNGCCPGPCCIDPSACPFGCCPCAACSSCASGSDGTRPVEACCSPAKSVK